MLCNVSLSFIEILLSLNLSETFEIKKTLVVFLREMNATCYLTGFAFFNHHWNETQLFRFATQTQCAV